MRALLLLFTKVPRPGRVKTRLCPPLSPEEAAGLHHAFLTDLARSIPRAPEREARLAVDPWADRAELEGLGLPLVPQEGEGLGERMARAFDAAFAEAYDSVVLRNTDSPALPEERVEEAFAALALPSVDCVLGPDNGGGYYLVGLKRPHDRLFDLPSLGYDETVERARELGLATLGLRSEPDVDLPADLDALRELLAAEPSIAAETARYLASLG